VAVLHSGLGERDRRLQWERVRRGEARVALGARSAVFAPLRRVGLIVVDEEHDGSYKQEEGLRYNAKHVALMRARTSDAVAILGSATPDIETFWAAQTGRYRSVVLPRRVRAVSPPEIRIVDLRQEERRRRGQVLLSEPLQKTVEEALGRGEQALLFLNRRGFSPAFLCSSCGEAVYCRHCSIALTLHRAHGSSALLCHYCGNRLPPAPKCPGCGSDALAPAGAGTQKLVEAALQAWPAARVLRLDRDTARKEGAAEVLGTFHRGEADVLVGTQMVAKGHHFPRLTVVGVVDADQSLHLPDFRAAERTFQVLTQVAGRAGREMLSGLALFQTRNPDHPVIRAAAAGDYDAFANEELEARREAGFPPFRRLGLVRVAARTEEGVRRAAELAAAEARRLAAPNGVEVLGPAPAPIERIRAWWRFQVLLRAPGPEPSPLQRVLRQFLVAMAATARTDVRIHVDVDPVSML
jgi:primosomal protein N' (replication factor Y)